MDAPPTPHIPQRRRITRLALTLTLSLLALTLIAWAFSHSRLLIATRKSGSLVAPGGPAGEPDAWTYRARTLHISQLPGELSFGLSEYRSLAPTRAELDTWQDWRGWSTDIIPAAALTPSAAPIASFHSATDFNLLGLGTTITMRSGEESRLITIPHWLLTILLSTLAFTLWFPHHRRARRIHRNQCPRCAYDRSATPPQSPCPECGRMP